MDKLIRQSDAIKSVLGITMLQGRVPIDTVIYQINSIPAVEPKHGEWKRRIVDNGFNADWVCSECGYRVKTDFVDYNFCPNCGAKMKGADDEKR